MDLRLRGKVALATGSSRGIGLATASAFAAEGCRVMLSARSTEQLRETEEALRATGAEVAAHAADVGSPDDAARLIEVTVAAYGGIDILRSCCEQHVLHCWVNRRARRARRSAAFEARDDPDGSLMNVCGQTFCRVEQPQKSLPAHARGRFTSPIPWCDLLVPRALVVGPDSLLDLRISDYQEPPALHVSATRGADAQEETASHQLPSPG
jgi:hypothetical protein